jgi:hypothetical protein
MNLTLSAAASVSAIWRMVVTVSFIFALAWVGRFWSGCKALEGNVVGPELEHAYTAEIVACAALAGLPGTYDKAEDLACRARVNCRYGLGPCLSVVQSAQ